MVHIRFAHPRWQAPRRLGLPGRLLVGALALGIGLAVAMLALLSGIVLPRPEQSDPAGERSREGTGQRPPKKRRQGK